MRIGASGRSVKDSAPEAWPSEVRRFLGPTPSLPLTWSPSRGASASTAALSAQGVRGGLRSDPSSGSILYPECRAAARRWRRRQASRQYRRTSNGQEKRRDQSQRYRCRCAERRRAAEAQAANTAGPDTSCSCPEPPPEGQRPAVDSGFFCCDRPGCEEHFAPSTRSPCRRFCSPSCRQALRRVIERERRWRQRARRARRRHPTGRCRGP